MGIFLEDGEVKAVNAEPEKADDAAPAKPKKTRKAKNEKQGELIK